MDTPPTDQGPVREPGLVREPGRVEIEDEAEPGDLAPLPYDGVASVAVGTVLWLVALVAMLPFTDDLRRDGRLWWIATAACGFVLGLVGLWIVVRRRNRLRAAESDDGPPTNRD